MAFLMLHRRSFNYPKLKNTRQSLAKHIALNVLFIDMEIVFVLLANTRPKGGETFNNKEKKPFTIFVRCMCAETNKNRNIMALDGRISFTIEILCSLHH